MLEYSTPATARAEAAPQARRRARGDRPLVLGLILLVLALTALPYLYAYLSSPPGRQFQGIMLDVPDTAQYFSWLRDHRSQLLVANRMTPEANQPAIFNLLWIIVGRAAALTGWSFAALFQILRVVAVTALLLALYDICRLLTRDRAEGWTAYLIAVFGAGLGWVWVLAKYLGRMPELPFPGDIYTYEPNSLVIGLAFPHFTVATALIVTVLGCFLRALQTRRWRWALLGALAALALTLQHAYDLLIIGLVPAGALALIWLRDRRIPWFGGLSLALVGLFAAPPALYFTWLTSRNPLWREVLAQFANAGVYTPSPPHLLILMGLPLVLSIAALLGGLRRIVIPHRAALRSESGGITGEDPSAARRSARGDTRALLRRPALAGKSDADLLLWAWAGVGFLLLYVPTDFQIHMLTAWQIPLALLAARWLRRTAMPWMARSRPRLARALPALLLAAVLPTNIYYLAWRVVDLSRHAAPYYLSEHEAAALSWLGAQATRDDVVLSGLALGQYVPVYSDARTFLGHWAQTVDFYGKQAAVASFFAAGGDGAARGKLIERFAVRYVIYGPEERALGPPPVGLEPAFQSGDVTVYRIR